MNPINLNIAGDLFLGRRVETIAINNPDSLFDNEIKKLFSASDFNIVNLESPLTNAGNEYKILKTGPNLKAAPETVAVLKSINTTLVTLANNHSYDFGDKGIGDTLEVCKKNNIATVGAALSLDEAADIFYKKISDINIAVVNIAENEWGNANDKHGGANPMGIVANTKSIKEAKSKADIVILIIHGGHEYYNYPSPRMVEQYRFYAQQGASVIICHHSHCISGYEIFEDVPIFYGLGNFLFDAETSSNGWHEGMVVNLQINSQKKIEWDIYLYKQCKENLRVELLTGIEKSVIEDQIIAISSVISNQEELKKKFNELVESQRKYVLSMFSTAYLLNYKYFRSGIRKLGFERFFLRRSQLKSVLNYFRCEAHKDITFEVLINYLKNK